MLGTMFSGQIPSAKDGGGICNAAIFTIGYSLLSKCKFNFQCESNLEGFGKITTKKNL